MTICDIMIKDKKNGGIIMKKKLFGNNIKPACRYCMNCKHGENNKLVCSKYGDVQSYDSCKSYQYSPLKRIPKKELCIAHSDANEIDF